MGTSFAINDIDTDAPITHSNQQTWGLGLHKNPFDKHLNHLNLNVFDFQLKKLFILPRINSEYFRT